MSSEGLSERLSAYLDGELSALERAALEQELEHSDEARQRLAELKAVDRLARELSVPDTPSGYQLGFPVRIREQLERERVAKARPLPRQKAKRWAGARTWAAATAAALFVAVLLPLLDSPATLPEREPTSRAGEAPTTPATQAEGSIESAAAVATRAPDAAGSLDPPALDPPALKTAPRARQAPATELPATRKRAVERSELLEESVPAAAPAAPAARARRAERPDEKAAPEPTPEPAADRAAPRRSAASVATEGLVPRAPAPVPPARKPARTDPQSLAEAPLVADDDAGLAEGFARAPAREERYRGLRARTSRTVAESRELREAWRAYATADSGSAQADEARVQVIEEGLHAYTLSGEAIDQETARRDAAAYLKRSDARQGERVHALVRTLDGALDRALESEPIDEE